MPPPLLRIIEQLKREPSRTGSIVITVFGDAIVPRGGSVWLGTLLEFFQYLDIDNGVDAHRAPDGRGSPLDQNRVAYLRSLRRERRQSPRGEPDADFQRAKSELIRLRIAEKQRHLIPLEEAISHMDEVVGLFLTHLSGLSARCGGRDKAVRRAIDQAVYQIRVEISEAATKLADQHGEPPLDDEP